MAMTMADNVIRKACDRCHTQKLSCRRFGDEACERCVRLKTECKYSPSLRYKKQQHPPHEQFHQHQHAYQQQQQHHPQPQQQVVGAETSQGGRRSPKRRRTESDPSLVPPEAVAPSAGELATTHPTEVTPDSLLELGDFNFNFDQLEFFAQPQQPEQHLSQPVVPNNNGVEGPHQPSSWHDRRPLAPSSGAFQEVAPTPFAHVDSNPPQQAAPSAPSRRRSRAPAHDSSDKRQRPRAKKRSRQITLRQAAVGSQKAKARGTPSLHWMAELSEINSSLLDLNSALPQQGTAHAGHSLARSSDDGSKHPGFSIDEMFQLTGRVADILDQLSTGSPNGDRPRPDSSDPGNSMFILSTYVRLLDMYQRVFSLVRKELFEADADLVFAFWKMPDVTVGSFAVDSSPPLHMCWTIQVAEGFLSRLRRSTSALDSPASGSGGGDHPSRSVGEASLFSEVVGVSFQAVKSREERLSRHLAELRGEIEAQLDS